MYFVRFSFRIFPFWGQIFFGAKLRSRGFCYSYVAVKEQTARCVFCSEHKALDAKLRRLGKATQEHVLALQGHHAAADFKSKLTSYTTGSGHKRRAFLLAFLEFVSSQAAGGFHATSDAKRRKKDHQRVHPDSFLTFISSFEATYAASD